MRITGGRPKCSFSSGSDDRSSTAGAQEGWATFRRFGIGVDKVDGWRQPPDVALAHSNQWRTALPPVNTDKLPHPHAPAKQVSTRGRTRSVPDRLGMGTVCAQNKARNVECTLPCEENAPVTQAAPSAFMLKFHEQRGWGLHATRTYEAGDYIEEYVGEVLSWREGNRRARLKTVLSPSYLHAMQEGVHFVDAEATGNAMRFINHTCVHPNSRNYTVWVAGQPRIQVLAHRTIQVGEELTGSYEFLCLPGSTCLCAHAHCQGFMGKEVTRIPGTNTKIPKPQVT